MSGVRLFAAHAAARHALPRNLDHCSEDVTNLSTECRRLSKSGFNFLSKSGPIDGMFNLRYSARMSGHWGAWGAGETEMTRK
jgi:hypothetical protein